MAKKTTKKRSIEGQLTVPSFIRGTEGVFEDIQHYRTVASRVIRALATNSSSSSSLKFSGSSLYEGIVVEFSTEYKAEEVHLDAFRSLMVLRAPLKKGESQISLNQRRMQYLGQLLMSVEAMKTVGISQVYLSLKPEGRRRISKPESKQSKSKK